MLIVDDILAEDLLLVSQKMSYFSAQIALLQLVIAYR